MPVTKTITVTLAIDAAHEGKLPDGETIATYLAYLLKQDSRPGDDYHLTDPTVFMEPPTVAINVSGGMVQEVHSEIPTQVVTLDYDVEGVDEDQLRRVPDLDGSLSEAAVSVNSAEVQPAWVEAIVKSLEEKEE